MWKRKQPDDDEQLGTMPSLNPLVQDHIENEYENLDDDDDELENDGVPKAATLDKNEYEQIIKAQQPATVARDGDIEFTPFNLVNELEEGSFDKAGNFIFKKRGDDNDDEDNEGGNDTWAESIDWAEVERKEKERKEQQKEFNRAQVVDSQKLVRDEPSCYREMLRIMRSDETVQKTIRRLGNNIPRRRPFNRNARKAGQSSSTNESSNDQTVLEETKRKLDLMIELADQRLRDGDMDIYQKSYDDLEEAIN